MPAWRSWKPRRSSRVTMPRKPSPNGIAARTRPPAGGARRAAEPGRALVLDPDREEAHPRRLPGERPEGEQVEGAEDDPGGGAEDQPGGRDAVAAERRGEHSAADSRKAPLRITPSNRNAIAAGDQPESPVGSRRGLPNSRRTKRSRPTSRRSATGGSGGRCRDQADALRGDRLADLGRLGDPLDQLLGLVGGEQPIPGVVDQLGVERLDRGALDRRAREGALERLLGGVGLEHADDRALDRRALERPDDRLLGRDLDRVVDPGRRGDPLAGARADAEQPRRQRGRRPRAASPGAASPRMVAGGAVGTRRGDCDDCGVRTAIVSDLHLGLGSGADLLRRERFASGWSAGSTGVDRLVLLGDVLELRDRPLAEVLEGAAPVIAALGEAIAGRELVIVPGNHDHHLIEPWLERRRSTAPGRWSSSRPGEPEGLAFEALCEQAARPRCASPTPGSGSATTSTRSHGHYLDRHLTVPTIERLGVAAIERVLGIAPTGPTRSSRRRAAGGRDRRVRARADAGLRAALRARPGDGRRAPRRRRPVDAPLADDGRRRDARRPDARLAARLGRVPGAVGVANRLGLGPVRSDLSAGAIGRAGFEAMADVVERLRIDAEHVIFGHTHRRGGPEPRGADASSGTPAAGSTRRACSAASAGGQPLLARDDLRRRRGRARAAPPARRPQPRGARGGDGGLAAAEMSLLTLPFERPGAAAAPRRRPGAIAGVARELPARLDASTPRATAGAGPARPGAGARRAIAHTPRRWSNRRSGSSAGGRWCSAGGSRHTRRDRRRRRSRRRRGRDRRARWRAPSSASAGRSIDRRRPPAAAASRRAAASAPDYAPGRAARNHVTSADAP